MKKQFLRVKQIADQTFLRAEKTEVLTEDLVTAEKRIDVIRVSCQTTQKKISSCNIDFGSEASTEKRLRKIPQIALGTSMLENGNNFSKCSVLGETLRECSTVQTKLGNELLDYCNEVEKTVLKPISFVLENDVHNIGKLRKQLGKLVLDMDSARTRFQTAERHSMQASSNTSLNTLGKIDSLKDELEDASQKVEQCRDTLATEMFSLISKEPQLAQLFVHFHRLQAEYHRNALAALEASLPLLEQQIVDFPLKPVYGCSLEEHLRVTNREIALTIETCVSFLLEYGILEEGLLRIAGSTSKVKKLKSAFDAGVEMDMTEFIRDPHAVSGALKSYLRELPEPLVTFSLYEEWINAAKIQDFDAKLQALWQVLHKLPDANFKNLQFVIKFLSRIYENVDVNKMSSQNIAIVMAPNLIWSVSDDASRMNMTTASLHTSIVDTLISYADWFFPDDVLPSPKAFTELNDSSASDILNNEPVSSDDAEINGNNLQSQTPSKDASSCSPRVHHRNVKKPAAPPPPAQRSAANCDKNINDAVIPTGELIDFSSGDFVDPSLPARSETVVVKTETIPPQEKSSASHLTRRKSNENFNNSGELSSASRSEKPVVPDKPAPYSSCSLDRRSHRQSSGVECMVRSCHIERPTVPPPERPAKPPKFCSTENISDAHQEVVPRPNSVKEASEQGLQHSRSSTKVNRFDFLVNQNNNKPPERSASKPPKLEMQQEAVLAPDSVKDASELGLQHSRSSTNVNRFDFLVNQNNEKPPERPPRSTVDHERTSSSSIPETVPEVEDPFQKADSCPSVSPRAYEVERVKPPRPQPPLPAKPKFNTANENTSL